MSSWWTNQWQVVFHGFLGSTNSKWNRRSNVGINFCISIKEIFYRQLSIDMQGDTFPIQILGPCPKAKLYRSMFFSCSGDSSHLSGRNLSGWAPNTDSSRWIVHAWAPTFDYPSDLIPQNGVLTPSGKNRPAIVFPPLGTWRGKTYPTAECILKASLTQAQK